MSVSLRVLIVEDSEDDATLLIRELRRGGYEPIYVRVETPEAMKSALTTQTWDIVISDYVMPKFSGLEALRVLKRSGLNLPFIIISGKIGEETAVEAMKAAGLRHKVKIMIGGGQITEEVRTYTGADAYGMDAMAGVTLAKKWAGVK